MKTFTPRLNPLLLATPVDVRLSIPTCRPGARQSRSVRHMPACLSNMGNVAQPSRQKFSGLYWLVLGFIGIVVLWMVLPLRSRPIERGRLIDLETSQIRLALQSYDSAFGGFPVGDSPAIFRALRGGNPQKMGFLECPIGRVSQDGSMLDPWGTPYKIYFSGKELLIRSAGPNKHFDDSSQKEFDDYIR